jgi:hypothetical protein
MSRNTILQIIAALITVAVLAGIHQGSGWILRAAGPQFAFGFVCGMVLMCAGFLIANKIDRSSIGRGREQQRSRDVIDL